MATWRTALNLTQDEVATLGDQINYLGNTSSEETLKLAEVVTTVGSLGGSAGLAAGEVAALAAGMTGVDASVSANAIKSMTVAMTAGSAATTKQQNVLKQLGFTATGMAERMQTDAQGAIMDLLGAINQLPEAQRNAALNQYFGKGSIQAIAPLLNNLENLEEQFAKVGDASIYAGSMEAEYAARSDTTANKVQLAQNQMENLQIKIGQFLIPIVGKAAEAFGGFIDRMSEVVETHGPALQNFAEGVFQVLDEKVIPALEGAVKWVAENGDAIVILAAGVGAAVLAYKAYKAAVVAQKAVMGVYNIVTAASATGTFTLSAAMSVLQIRMLAVAGVIGLLVAAGVWLYKNWDEVKAKAAELGAKIGEIWESISTAVQTAIDAISERFPMLGAFMQGWWESVQDAWNNIKAIFSNIIEFIDNVFSGDWSAAWENVKNIFVNVFGAIGNLAKAPLNGIISAINFMLEKVNGLSVTMPDWVPGVGGKTLGGFNIPMIPTIPELASGGIATGATLAMVGEGSEPEAILPLSRLAAMLDGMNPKPRSQGGGDADGEGKIIFAPVFHFSGPVQKSDVEAAARVSFEEFKAMYRRLKAEERRKSFSNA